MKYINLILSKAEIVAFARKTVQSALYSALLLACSTSPSRFEYRASNGSTTCSDTVVLGRITNQSYSELPRDPHLINMDVLWTLHVRVKKVINGVDPGPTITVVVIAHSKLREDKDFTFHLRRVSGGRYVWDRSGLDCIK